MSCCAPPLAPLPNMLALSQVSLLVAEVSSTAHAVLDDANNNNHSLALKALSARGALALSRAGSPGGPKRCLFGAPSTADTQRLLREDQAAVKARMVRRWGWDLSREGPSASSSSTWQWESTKGRAPRRHPYAARLTSPRPVFATATPVPKLLSPLAAAPTGVMDTSATSSSSGTSTMPASPASPVSACPASSPLPKTRWDDDSESDDSCCGDSGSESDSSTTCSRRQHAPVQTRLTDFWRTRRCSTGDGLAGLAKTNPMAVPTTRTPVRTCSV